MSVGTILVTDHLNNMRWPTFEIGSLLFVTAETIGGDTARLASRKRPRQPVLAISPLIEGTGNALAAGNAGIRL